MNTFISAALVQFFVLEIQIHWFMKRVIWLLTSKWHHLCRDYKLWKEVGYMGTSGNKSVRVKKCLEWFLPISAVRYYYRDMESGPFTFRKSLENVCTSKLRSLSTPAEFSRKFTGMLVLPISSPFMNTILLYSIPLNFANSVAPWQLLKTVFQVTPNFCLSNCHVRRERINSD